MKKETKIQFEDIAVAVKYIFGTSGEIPKILASGRGHLAAKIIEIAKKHRIPTRKEKLLAESLAKIPVGLDIPPELWEAMAEVLAHVYHLDGSMKND